MSNYYERYKQQIDKIISAIQEIEKLNQEFIAETKDNPIGKDGIVRRMREKWDYKYGEWLQSLASPYERNRHIEENFNYYLPLSLAKAYDKWIND